MSKPTKSDCAGCRDDFYNHNRMGLNEKPDGTCECWSFKDATMVKARDVHVDLRPPYLHIPLTLRPSCWRGNRVSRVKPESLTADGFWK